MNKLDVAELSNQLWMNTTIIFFNIKVITRKSITRDFSIQFDSFSVSTASSLNGGIILICITLGSGTERYMITGKKKVADWIYQNEIWRWSQKFACCQPNSDILNKTTLITGQNRHQSNFDIVSIITLEKIPLTKCSRVIEPHLGVTTCFQYPFTMHVVPVPSTRAKSRRHQRRFCIIIHRSVH